MQAVRTSQEIIDENLEYSLFSWSVQGTLAPLAVVGGQGAWFWDADGKRYLDLCSQQVKVMNLGHQHPRVVQAIKEQADTICYVAPSYATEPKGRLAHLVAEKSGL